MSDTLRENEEGDAKRRDQVLQKANLIKIQQLWEEKKSEAVLTNKKDGSFPSS